jgi:hypothetical protein
MMNRSERIGHHHGKEGANAHADVAQQPAQARFPEQGPAADPPVERLLVLLPPNDRPAGAPEYQPAINGNRANRLLEVITDIINPSHASIFMNPSHAFIACIHSANPTKQPAIRKGTGACGNPCRRRPVPSRLNGSDRSSSG